MTLALEDVTVRRGEKALLDGVAISAEAGRVTALCGPNGAGKTTALSVLAGSLAPNQGRAVLNGVDVRKFGLNALARHRAVLSQTAKLGFPFLVHEVVAIGRSPHNGVTTPAQDAEIVALAMAHVDVAAFAERNYLTLSGGERQRVQLARTLAQIWEPPPDGGTRWLLLDEPTSALDLKHQIDLMHLLRRFAADGWGVVVVLHDLRLVKAHADDVILMKLGEVAATGPAEEVLTPQSIQAVFDLNEPFDL